MNKSILSIAILISGFGFSQTIIQDTTLTQNQQQNAANTVLSVNRSKGVIVGGYAQVDYNQPEGDNGNLDVHRLVMLLG